MTQTSQNIFEELGFSVEESENLRIRSDLMISLRKLIRSPLAQAKLWSLEEAAMRLKTTNDREEFIEARSLDLLARNWSCRF